MTHALEIEAVRSIIGALPNESLAAARLEALSQLQRNGLPGPKDEDWKYTDLSSVIDISNEWAAVGGRSSSVADELIARASAAFDIDWLIIRNGSVDAKSVASLDRPGLCISLLSEGTAIPGLDAPLSDMNAALLHDGIKIEIATDYDDDRPIGLLHVDSVGEDVGVSQTRIAIDLAENSSAGFIEYHTSAGNAAHYANSVIDVSMGTAARADYVRIQDRGAAHSQTGYLLAKLSARSQFNHAGFDFGGRMVRNDLDIRIEGPESLASFCGLYLADGGQHIDNHTRVDHMVGPARSEQEYRGILTGRSRCIWNGKAIVHAGADGTDANQANHNLLLSERSEVDAKPELEIYADDVKCSHGTTIGQLDETALFYLRTRGIDDFNARQLLTRAFAQKIVDLSPIISIQQDLSDWVAKRLSGLITGDTA